MRVKTQIAYVKNQQHALLYREQGYEPVECAFKKSIVGHLNLDHHCENAHQLPVCLTAHGLAVGGVRRNKFVVTGSADPDAVYAVLVLSGSIKPDEAIARAIAELDIDHPGIDRTKGEYLRNALFDMHNTPGHSKAAWERALAVGKETFGYRIESSRRDDIIFWEQHRLQRGRACITELTDNVALMKSDEPNLDVGHAVAELVMQYKPALQVVTVSGLTRTAASRLKRRPVYDILGSLGLHAIQPALENRLGRGMGGRPCILGSERHKRLSQAQVNNAYLTLVDATHQAKPL